MCELTYAEFIFDIPIFIDKTCDKDTAYLLDMSQTNYNGEPLGLEGMIILANSICPKLKYHIKKAKDIMKGEI